MDKHVKKRIVLKLGSNTLTNNTLKISRGKIEDIARQIAELNDNYEFVIVSSGAIATAKQFVKSNDKQLTLDIKQALAAIGQPILMEIFNRGFADIDLKVSQCLFTEHDFKNDISKTNIINTINALLEHQYIPIINENDTVATEEIQFGDNDKLAALTATLIKADLLIIATNTDGIYSKKASANGEKTTILNVTSIEDLKHEILENKSSLGTGGMASKIEALKITKKAGIETWIVNGIHSNFICDALANKIAFTKSSS